MPRVFFLLFALIVVFHVLRWFFTVALPEIFRVIGMLWDWLVEVASGLCSDLTSSWNALRDRIGTRPDAVTKECHHDDQSLLDSPTVCDIKNHTYTSQPSKPMWPFRSDKDEPFKPVIPSAAGQSRPSPSAPPSVQAVQLQAELNKAKHELAKAHEALAKAIEESKVKESELSALNHYVRSMKEELECAQSELEQLRPFAAMKSEARRVTYTVSPELHKKWQSIMRDTTRLQVVELLGQPSEILTVTEAGAVSPIQMVRKSAPAPRKELCDHVMSLVGMDLRLRELLRGSGCTAWVYSDDTLAPGVIFFSTESLGGQISRIFPPEC